MLSSSRVAVTVSYMALFEFKLCYLLILWVKKVLSSLKQSISLSQLHIDHAHFYAKSRNQEEDFLIQMWSRIKNSQIIHPMKNDQIVSKNSISL